MKRVLLSVLGTIIGLVALLSFKSHNSVVLGTRLPAAGGSSAGTGGSSSGAPVTTPPVANPPSNAPSTGKSAAPPTASTARSFDGPAVQTQYGTVQVRVTVQGTRIINVSFLQLTSQDGRSADINSQAAPLLVQETLSAQSSNIDTISGATYTSEGYLQSLQNALDQAGLK